MQQAPLGPQPKKRERLVEMSSGHIVIGKTWLLSAIAIVLFGVGCIGFWTGGIAHWRLWGTLMGLAIALFITAQSDWL